jgi:hypothetical protein
MRHFRILSLIGLFLLASCGYPSSNQAISKSTPASYIGRVRTTTILSEGLDIAVMIASPKMARYPGGGFAHL